MIIVGADVQAAINKLNNINRIADFYQANTGAFTLPDAVSSAGKQILQNNSMQRIMTNRSPEVGGPYKSGKKASVRKFAKKVIKPSDFFISFVSRSKNTANINIGINLAGFYGIPIETHAHNAGEWSDLMRDLIPYDFAGQQAADMIKIRHFGSGAKGNLVGYSHRRIYPHQLRLFFNYIKNNSGTVQTRFLSARFLSEYLQRVDDFMANEFSDSDDERLDKYDIFQDDDSYLDDYESSISSRKIHRRKTGTGYNDDIARQLGVNFSNFVGRKKPLSEMKVSGQDKLIANKIVKTGIRDLVIWHKGVPTYGWFRDFNFQPYATDIKELSDTIKGIVDAVLKQHGVI